MTEPAGAFHDRLTALPAIAVATTLVGAAGALPAVIEPDVAPGPSPRPLVATTVKVYTVPAVNPDTVAGLAVLVAVMPPGVDVTVYWVMAFELLAAAVQVTVALLPEMAMAETPVGAPGTSAAVIEFDGAEEVLPPALIATTVKV